MVTGEGCRRDSGKRDLVRRMRGGNCGYRRGMQEGQWEKRSGVGGEGRELWLQEKEAGGTVEKEIQRSW